MTYWQCCDVAIVRLGHCVGGPTHLFVMPCVWGVYIVFCVHITACCCTVGEWVINRITVSSISVVSPHATFDRNFPVWKRLNDKIAQSDLETRRVTVTGPLIAVQPFLPDGANVHAHLLHVSSSPPNSPPRAVQPFLHSQCRILPMRYIAPSHPPKLPISVWAGISTPPHLMHRSVCSLTLSTSNGISIKSAVLPQCTFITNGQTDRNSDT